MKTIVIDGDAFSDLTGFYDEIERKFMKVDWKMGRNLNAFNDVMRGGFIVTEYEDPLKVVWNNSTKSKNDLSKSFDTILEIIGEHKHINLELQ